MVAGDEGSRLFPCQQRSDGETAAQALGQGHHVGRGVVELVGEEGAAAAQSRLHLVQHEEDARLAAPLPHLTQVVGRRNDDAVLALHRLQQHRRRALGSGAADGIGIAVRDADEARRQRLEGGAVTLHPTGRDGGQGAAMEGALGNDDLVSPLAVVPSPATGQLDGRLHRLGPRITEKGALHTGGLAEQPGQLQLGHSVEQVGDVHERPALFFQGLHHHRMAVPQAHASDAGHQVQVPSALVVVHVAALAADQHHRQSAEEREEILALQLFPVFHRSARLQSTRRRCRWSARPRPL
ncbi:hypothetical protein HRbin24_00991 [bacterium HR24]|nr:hypothetical protein HRbin24_00991 [bacterium HR24]